MMAFDEACIFCKIATKSAQSSIIFEDNLFIAFLDIKPVFLGHSLLIPKLHVETFNQLSNEVLPKYFTCLQKIADAIQKGLQCDGTFIGNNNIVSQSVPHLHFHVIPRRFKDGLKGFFWPRTKYENEDQVEEIRKKISAWIK